jgi:hypothetical protein
VGQEATLSTNPATKSKMQSETSRAIHQYCNSEKKTDNREDQFCHLYHSNSARHFSLIFPRTPPFSITNWVHTKRLRGSARRKDSLTEALRDLQKSYESLKKIHGPSYTRP